MWRVITQNFTAVLLFFFSLNKCILKKANIAGVYKPIEQRERRCKNGEDGEKFLTRSVDLIRPVRSPSRYSSCEIGTGVDQRLGIFTHSPHMMLHHQQYCCDVTPKTTCEETAQDKRGWEQARRKTTWRHKERRHARLLLQQPPLHHISTRPLVI